MAGQTLYDKLYEDHLVKADDQAMDLIYIDRHLIHEVTSPQAFEGLRLANREPHRIDSILAVPDHNVPTTDRSAGITDPVAKLQIDTLDENCQEYGIVEFDMADIRQGIVHVIGPEQGATLPGMTIVCGDSHTATHGAFGALAFGIGTSEVEHVLATQCLRQQKMKNMLVRVNGKIGDGLSAKDIVLAIIGHLGTAGGTGHAIEFAGSAIEALSMEGRMTVCNMAIEAGARVGMIAVDQTTIDYLQGLSFSPKGQQWQDALSNWENLHSDADASFDTVINIDAETIEPQVTWGTSPEMVLPVSANLPEISNIDDHVKREGTERALKYMGLSENSPVSDIKIDRVFIGSCTNSRIEDIRVAASVVKNCQVAESVKEAIVVPGSGLVKQQAEEEGLDTILLNAGFQWREPGCSMCLAMNDDRLEPGEHCASTSNRNFEGRQGQGGRTHLVSPAMAAAAAIKGHFVDIRHFMAEKAGVENG